MRSFLGLIIVLAFSVSCDDASIYTSYETLNGGWDKQEPVTFKLPELDSVASYNTFITMRVNHEYAYSNLFLITRMGYPNGKVETDTLEYKMAEPSGELLGKGIGDIKENKLWYKEGVRFRESGTYTVTIEQAMRANGNVAADQKLKGITEIGLRIERQAE
ncbi:gliding motility lipoprotein GldH [Dokdonia sinensis]|uniref:Gliding motility lipoprotein GldH n=1 Tax=Dokdonia sinensis TaxID=2479847 RepID=A0A3M0GP92_9FLAO|nr:gliding motility lipoprotein GldH [Dokdonia sinensis]RMB59096.1 gliding motility lipoprotein GldH [Dokdonia sinensis]